MKYFMLADVFSSLDGFHWSLWILPSLSLSFLLGSMWTSQHSLSLCLAPLKSMMSEQSQRTKGASLGGLESVIVVLFLIILAFNWTGMIPYAFCLTSHLVVSASLALVAWLAIVSSSITRDVGAALAALAPSGAPSGLLPFLVLVETLSMLIRPLTLSVRLAANMSAGHLIMGLAGSYICVTSSVLMFQVVYTLFEIGVCLVQSYVFALLLTLYADEHPA